MALQNCREVAFQAIAVVHVYCKNKISRFRVVLACYFILLHMRKQPNLIGSQPKYIWGYLQLMHYTNYLPNYELMSDVKRNWWHKYLVWRVSSKIKFVPSIRRRMRLVLMSLLNAVQPCYSRRVFLEHTFLPLEELYSIHWSTLLTFITASKRTLQP